MWSFGPPLLRSAWEIASPLKVLLLPQVRPLNPGGCDELEQDEVRRASFHLPGWDGQVSALLQNLENRSHLRQNYQFRYQRVQFLLVCLPTIIVSMHALSWSLAAVYVPHRWVRIMNSMLTFLSLLDCLFIQLCAFCCSFLSSRLGLLIVLEFLWKGIVTRWESDLLGRVRVDFSE